MNLGMIIAVILAITMAVAIAVIAWKISSGKYFTDSRDGNTEGNDPKG